MPTRAASEASAMALAAALSRPNVGYVAVSRTVTVLSTDWEPVGGPLAPVEASEIVDEVVSGG